MEVGGGGGANQGEVPKNHERENFAGKKSFTASSLEKNSGIDLPKYFTEILASCTTEQFGVKTFCS